MNQTYPDFRARNPTPDDVLCASLGAISPDPKGPTLGALGREPSSAPQLYRQLIDLCGGYLPVKPSCIDEYLNANGTANESLVTMGFAAKTLKVTGNLRYPLVRVYQATDAGRDFGPPLAALGTMLVNELLESSPRPRYCSLRRILGEYPTNSENTHRMVRDVALVTETLAKEPGTEFRLIDIATKTGLDRSVAKDIVIRLGTAGIIDYKSLRTDPAGNRRDTHVVYSVKDTNEFARLDPEQVYERYVARTVARAHYIDRHRGDLLKVIDHIKTQIKTGLTEHDCHSIAEATKIHESRTGTYLKALRNLGYLSSDFTGAEIKSIATANPHTVRLWNELIQPVEIFSRDLRPPQSFYRALEIYERDPGLGMLHRQNQMRAYISERTHRGKAGGEEIRKLILEAVDSGHDTPADMLDYVRKKPGSRPALTRSAVKHQLHNLMRTRHVGRVPKSTGHYRLLKTA
jgi:DNA-binding MarR family transcriptional regulator